MNAPLAIGITTLTALVSGIAIWSQQAEASGGRTVPVARAAKAFLDGLTAEQRKLAQRPLSDAERTAWNFVPGRYAGIEIGALDAGQKAVAHELLRSMLSVRGYEKTSAIMALEDVLREIETGKGQDASHRDPARYALLVLGEPEARGTYVVRFQGHHVSLQVAVRAGELVGHTPQFLGSNPHAVAGAPAQRRRVLGAEEDLARAFLLLLDEAQLQKAVIAVEAPKDVLLGPGKAPAELGPRRGVAWKDLNETQRGVLWRLVEEYAHVLRAEFAAQELAKLRAEGLDEMSFAWAGGRERGQGHYYRIHGLKFAIEYDCTQDDANHVHTVWRDFEHDFGGDPMREHLEHDHAHK
ncbi:MAG: DUF3500 domain-containing protein [Planctomycetes bacterium]|jgi:hypothetical protein|nr:DUF3500 domain-containing protein [Planctomycetota bacterium]MCC7064601.1 DUF3500 domain-containing protein [Planctomycetota bacterium]